MSFQSSSCLPMGICHCCYACPSSSSLVPLPPSHKFFLWGSSCRRGNSLLSPHLQQPLHCCPECQAFRSLNPHFYSTVGFGHFCATNCNYFCRCGVGL